MLGRQKQVLEAFQRVRAWLQANVAPDASPAHARLCAELSDVVDRAERAIAHQLLRERLSQARTQELRAAVRALRNRHLKPIAAIARASSDRIVGIERAAHLPRRRLPVTKLAAEARGLKTSVEPHVEWFVFNGRHPEFLAQLDAAVVEMERVQMQRYRALSLQVGATAALRQHLRRARQLVEILDCHVSSTFEGDEAKLAEWRHARRVQAKPGARREGVSADVVAVAEEQVERGPLTLSVAA